MPIMRRSAKLFLATKGNSANPGQANRCNAMTSGDSPDVTPWRAATKPKAQNKAAPAPQAMPKAVGYFSISDRALSIRLRIANSACAGKKLESAGRRDAPVLETHHMCSDLAHFRGDMADINHRNVSLITQAHEIRQDFSLVTGIERGERLVEQQKPRLHQQSPSDGDPRAFATRSKRGRRVSKWPMPSRPTMRSNSTGSRVRRLMRRPYSRFCRTLRCGNNRPS